MPFQWPRVPPIEMCGHDNDVLRNQNMILSWNVHTLGNGIILELII